MSLPQQFLAMMAGTMGSGKSHFARCLAARTGAARINADLIRQELFGVYEEWTKPANKARVFELVDNQTRQALQAGRSVIRDYQHDYRRDRTRIKQMADRAGALAVIVWLRVPEAVAVERALARPKSPDSIKFGRAFVEDAVRRHLERLEPPAAKELHIEIDGRLPFEDQYQAFWDFCAGRT